MRMPPSVRVRTPVGVVHVATVTVLPRFHKHLFDRHADAIWFLSDPGVTTVAHEFERTRVRPKRRAKPSIKCRCKPAGLRWTTEGIGMNNTRNRIFTGAVELSGRSVVRLRAQGTSGELTFDELPLAVGFGSPVEVHPRRLRAVPGLPVEFVGAPRSGQPGRVIALPVGDTLGYRPALDGSSFAGPTTALVRPEPVPLRLTARGRAVLLVAAAAIGLAVVVAAWFGASSSAAPAPSAPPTQVVVHDGDTLWSIAGRIAPNRDPRAIVDQLLRVNQLDTPTLVPGQVLRTR
jgi:LysM domain